MAAQQRMAIISANDEEAESKAAAAFAADGVVVISDVLSDGDIESCLDELWTSPRLLNRSGSVDRQRPATWSGDSGWPQQDGGRNFLASLDPFADRWSWQLAQHAQVVRFVRALYASQAADDGDDSSDWQLLLDGMGRWGVMRPAAERPAWRTDESWLHWDQSPYREPGFVRLQCFVAVSEQSDDAGGLLVVPGFHRAFRRWADDHPLGSVVVDGKPVGADHGRNQPFPLPPDDPCQAAVRKVCCPAGSLVLWDSRLPHQNFPNRSAHAFRVVHYLNFVRLLPHSSADDRQLLQARRDTMRRRCIVQRIKTANDPAAWPAMLTQLGRDIVGLPPSPSDDEEEIPPALRQAILLALEAGRLEADGDCTGSVERLRRACKLVPDFETEWYDAVFGN